MAKLTAKEIHNLIEDKVSKLSSRKALWLKYYNLYKGQAWWSENLYEGSKRSDVDNQIFPLVQSLTGYLQKISIIDRVLPPSQNDPFERGIATSFENALDDFWWFNQRRANLQKWFRNTLIKGNTYGFIRVDPKADYPFILEIFEPENIVKGSDKISKLQDQPWIARLASAKQRQIKSLMFKDKDFIGKLLLNHPDSNEDVTIWDFWSKQTQQNVLMTSSGLVLRPRDWPYTNLKLYPFFDLPDISVLGSSDAISTVQMLYTLQRTYDKQKIQIKENAEFMGNPPIVVDVESGIDTKKIEGKPRLIIRKYKDGEFRIVPVPPLPGYVERQPDKTRANMERTASWNDMMGSGMGSGQREKGAMSLLMGASFTSLDPKLRNLEAALNDANQIVMGFLKEFSYSAAKALSFRRASSFKGFSPSDISGKYLSDVDIKGLEPEREKLRAQEVAMFYKLGIIGRRKALEELGEKNPDQVMKEQEQEQVKALILEKEKTEYIERQRLARTEPTKPVPGVSPAAPSPEGEAPNPEAGSPTPINEGEAPAPAPESESNPVPAPEQSTESASEQASPSEERKFPKFIDYLGNILMPGFRLKLKALKFREEVRIIKPGPDTVVAKNVTILAPNQKDRIDIVSLMPEAAGKIIFIKGKKKVVDGEESANNSNANEDLISSNVLFGQVKKGILKSSRIKVKDLKQFQGMPGMFIVEPHAEMIWTRQKKLIIKGRAYPNFVDRDVLLLGDKVYGVIRLIYGGKISEKDVARFEKLHRVTDKERRKWWGKKPLYAYAFQIKRFDKPLAYEKPKGLQTYLKSVKLILPEEVTKDVKQAVPVTGGLKVKPIVPGRPFPVAKPEKKALKTSEVYSTARLKQILPAGHDWDVSEKMDGIRCQATRKGDTILLFTDEANKIPLDRVKPIIDEIRKKFQYDVSLDGELMLFDKGHNLKHQAIAGYIHSKQKPQPTDLAGLRYKIFDMLYIKDEDISKKPYSARSKALDLFLKEGGQVLRAKHEVGTMNKLPALIKKISSDEGVIVRAMDASYFHNALMYKVKKHFDLDVKVIGKEITKIGSYVYHTALRDGTYMGQTYAQKYVDAKPGDVIRVSVEHVTLRPSGQISWFSPKPINLKASLAKAPASKSLTQPKIGRADTLAQVKEIYLAGGGEPKRWTAWLPKFAAWRKTQMPKLIAKIKK